MKHEVRSRSGTPQVSDFASASGTPIVIDLDTGIAYYLDSAGAVQPLAGMVVGSPVSGASPDLIFHADGSGNLDQTAGIYVSGTDVYAKGLLFVGGTSATNSGIALMGNGNNQSGFIGPLSEWISSGTSLDLAIAAADADGSGSNGIRFYTGATPRAFLTGLGQFQMPTTGSGGGLLVGGDALWYRSAADTWRTPDSVIIDVDATVTGQLKVPTSGSAAGIVLGGDAQWYRSAADTLRTPDKVVIDSTMESSNYPLQPPYDLVGMFNGIPDASIDILRMEFVRSVTLPASLTGSIFEAETAATGSTTFDIKKNGSSVGSANFAAAATAATFTFASDVTFAAGDKLEVVAPATPDGTLANVHITLKGYRA